MVSGLLFSIGLAGVMLRRNIIVLNLDMQMSKPRNVQFQTRSIKDYGWQTTLLVYLEVRG